MPAPYPILVSGFARLIYIGGPIASHRYNGLPGHALDSRYFLVIDEIVEIPDPLLFADYFLKRATEINKKQSQLEAALQDDEWCVY